MNIPMTDKDYVLHKGIKCPVCGEGGNMLRTVGDLQQDDIYIFQDVACDACDARFNDRYSLEGYFHDGTDEEKEALNAEAEAEVLEDGSSGGDPERG